MPVAATEHLEIAQLYVRWPAERSPFAIELRLDLVRQLSMELDRGAQQGIEVGGVMLGRMLPSAVPTLRVEAIEFIRRRPEDGPTFLLNPSQLNLLNGICQAANAGPRKAIGLFRSHHRSELLRPSAADRSLIAEHFGGQPHALLLVQGRKPYSAAFFASDGGQLPAEATVSEFVLDEAALKTLPEVSAEEAKAATRPIRARSAHNRSLWFLGLLALVVAVVFVWLVAREPLRAPTEPGANQINLHVTPSGNVLRIDWNHTSRDILNSSDAVFVIEDGGAQPLQLSLDSHDLRFGSVEYQRQRTSMPLKVAMKLYPSGRTFILSLTQ